METEEEEAERDRHVGGDEIANFLWVAVRTGTGVDREDGPGADIVSTGVTTDGISGDGPGDVQGQTMTQGMSHQLTANYHHSHINHNSEFGMTLVGLTTCN